jgi:2-oxoglutarate ferredoxin oxidoreductase subunit delta
MPKVTVQKESCKGCGLCVQACPKDCLSLGKRFNAQGYAYVKWDKNAKCTGCAFCAELCPDMALRVYREERK